MEERSKRARTSCSNTASSVTFDVRGRLVKVLPELIRSHSNTLLSQLLDDVGTNNEDPIFVDANPDRFAHILDWYRYGCMFLPSHDSTEALLHDAAFFLLPDVVLINGVKSQLPYPQSPDVSVAFRPGKLLDKFEAKILAEWPSFDKVFEYKIQWIEKALERASGTENDPLGLLDLEPTVHICCAEFWSRIDRAWVLARRFESLGYRCSLSVNRHNILYLQLQIPNCHAQHATKVQVMSSVKVKTLHPGRKTSYAGGEWVPPGTA